MSILTIAELEELMREYAAAITRRDRRIVFVSILILALTVFTVLIYPKLFLVPVAGLAGLAVYVTATCHRWHRQHGISCPHCRRSLVALGEQLEDIFLGASAPDSLACPHCGEIVARQSPNVRMLSGEAPTRMKLCRYCGRQNDDEVACCRECGTALTAEVPPGPVDVLGWSPKSQVGTALATSLGALFLCSGVYCLVGAASFALLQAFHYAPPLDTSEDALSIAFFMFRPLRAILLAAAAIFIFIACKARCRKSWHAITTAVVTIAFLSLLKFMPGLWFVSLPAAFLLAFITRSSTGFFMGVALQVVVAMWLLGWFHKRA